jgi:ubiquinone/menaquinone biosynthesis C-methylase UbiE
MVYALDKDEAELQRLAESAKAAELSNIKVMVSSGKVALPLGDGCLDLVLLYDVLHGYYFSTDQREALFHEVKRVSKPGALLSVFPRHMADDEVAGEVVERLARTGFEVHDEYQGPVVHDDTVTGGHILTFRKATGQGRSFPSAADLRVPYDSLVREGA